MPLTAYELWVRHKPKWRGRAGGMMHCYVRVGHVYRALCDGHARRDGIGRRCGRPVAPLRCTQCDLDEIALGHAEESYPASP